MIEVLSRFRKPLLLALVAAVAALLCTLAVFACPQAEAASGSIYAGKLVRCYKHPVSGVIEDSGGQAAFATGQGMVEGCLSTKAQMEVTDDGQYFLTIRLGLIDYTSKRSFKVQNWGANSWSKTKFAVSKKGKDKNGTTYDYCIKVPSAKCIVRMTMFVTPMGRNVVCYMYPKSMKLGHEKGMVAKIVTSKSGKGSSSTLAGGNDSGSSDDSGSTGATSTMLGGGNSGGSGTSGSGTANSNGSSTQNGTNGTSNSSAQTGTTGGASGLDLSTDDGTGDTSKSGNGQSGSSQGMSPGVLFAVVLGAIVAAGVILLIITLVCVWYIRTRKNGWSTYDPDEYASAYDESVEAQSGQASSSDATRRLD